LRVLALAFALLGLAASEASAASVSFVGQFPHSSSKSISFTLDGDQVVGLATGLAPTYCASPASWATDSDAAFKIDEPAGAPLSLSNGTLSFSGTATSEDYGSGPASDPYGGQFTVMVTVNAAHTVATGTVSMTGAHDPFVSGCTASQPFIAIRSVTVSPIKADKAAYHSQFISFDYSDGVVSRLSVQANFLCGTGPRQDQSVNSAVFTGPAYGFPVIRTNANGDFSLETYVFDEYDEIVQLSISGHVRHGKASGKVVVSEPAAGYTGIAGLACHGNYAWHASKPVPPPPPGPTAFFQWAAIRVPFGSAYRYYFAVTGLQCSDHANELLVTVEGRRIVIPCSRGSAFASGPLAPSKAYGATSQAVEVSAGRIVRKGASVTVPVTMPGPGDIWVVISGLPGTPPS